MASCQKEAITYNVLGQEFQYKKEDLGIMVVMVDFIVIGFFIYFVYFLNMKQDEYIEEF